MPHKSPNGKFTLFTVNELREALDKLITERPECGDYDVDLECEGHDCGYTIWGGGFYISPVMHHVVLTYNPEEG